ncbi:hypothetical protein [Vibrio campbellii]|uniref:hypothetical protein n=1 Tax=Vibrio campbellii TaxID=680 RepID=UPI004057CBC4
MASDRFQCLSERNKSKREQCLTSLDMHEVDIYVLDQKGLVDLWLFEKKMKGLNEQQITDLITGVELVEVISAKGSLIHDLSAFYLLAEDLKKGGSILGTYEVTKKGAQSYISFSGNHKLRSIIKQSRYLSSNAQMLALGIGKLGLKTAAKGGVILTVIYSVPFRTLELALKKDYLLSNWVVNVSTDIVIAAISGVLGYFAGVMISAVTTTVLVPIGFGIAVAATFGLFLEYLEGEYLVKKKLIAKLNSFAEAEAKHETEMKIQRYKSARAMNQFLRFNNG